MRYLVRVKALLLLLLPLSFSLIVEKTRADSPQLYSSALDRFGVNVLTGYGQVNCYDLARLRASWYADWHFHRDPPRPQGVRFVQTVRVGERYYPPNWASLGQAVENNPGSLWLVGNEPDTRGQDEATPEQYAQQFHEIYHFIKEKDPSAQVAAGGIVQATPLRLHWLDEMVQAYLDLYGEPIPADAWHIHEQILREKHAGPDPEHPAPDAWGCGVPVRRERVIKPAVEPPYTMVAPILLPLYCTNTDSDGEWVRCQWSWHLTLPDWENQWQIPPTQTIATGEMYEIYDNASITLFQEHIQRFRQWMARNGQRDKPLVISEYGVLMPSEYLGGGDPAYGDSVVESYMISSFDYLLYTTDDQTGYPADGNRLVQQWAWYSLNDKLIDLETFIGYNGSLYDWRYPIYPGVLTRFGLAYAAYTSQLARRTLRFPLLGSGRRGFYVTRGRAPW